MAMAEEEEEEEAEKDAEAVSSSRSERPLPLSLTSFLPLPPLPPIRVTTLETGSRPSCEGDGNGGGDMVQTVLAIFFVKYEPPPPRVSYRLLCVLY